MRNRHMKLFRWERHNLVENLHNVPPFFRGGGLENAQCWQKGETSTF